jgi:P-type Mg2+ transporter
MHKETIQQLDEAQVITNLHASADGLTSSEARVRLAQYGPNVLRNEAKQRVWSLLLKQFKSPLIYLLIVAGVLSFLLKDVSDGCVITFILLINTGMGFYQELKSKNAIESLQKLVSKEILVQRDGNQVLIDENVLVVGDLVILREGDIVPADIKLYRVNNLSVNESQLTGESLPVSKTVRGATSLVYAGSTIEKGEAEGFIYATAGDTELGKIAHLSTSTKRVTQYEQSLSAFSSFLVKLTLSSLLLIFVFKLLITHDVSHISSLLLFIIALSIAVVPEAMPVIATVTLSNGALKLAKRHVIAKTLSAVEDMGNISILCSDKTGTLTMNNQTVKNLIADDPELFQKLAIASLELVDEKRKKSQSSFDRAFLKYVSEAIQQEASSYLRLADAPFDPAARRRRVVFSDGKKSYLVEIGSVETLLSLTKEKKTKEYLDTIKEDGKIGLRHLGIAYREVTYTTDADFDILKHEHELKFVGFVALEDPLRPTARRTIRLAEELGVTIKILSGDSREVTQYVAHEVGLIGAGQTVYIGDEIEKMSDAELSEVLKHTNAFARLNPEQKYRIIKLLKLHDNVVGYQGDGINDAPALKLADVAIAVNNATDVAQDSADILLLRSDIGVIINGIKYGRGIFSNINKYIRYTMIGNFGNFFALGTLYLLSASLPLLTIQLLLTNLLGDVPLIAISTDNVELAELQHPSKYDVRSLMFVSMILGSFTALFELLFFAIIKNQPLSVSRTSLYLYLTLLGFVVIFCVRNKDHFWKAPKLSRPLWFSFGLITAITTVMIYIKPTETVFSLTALSLSSVGLIIGMTALYLLFLDTIKVWFYKSKSAALSA